MSLGTVSNVLNHPDRVSPRTRARVEQVMTDLGFVPNESARQLRAGRSRTLAYVVLDASNPFFTDVAKGDIASGTELEFVFRIKDIDDRRGFTRYFWKGTPVQPASLNNAPKE